MKIRSRKKKCLLCILVVTALSLCACGSDKYAKRYQNYVKSLIALNYLGVTDEDVKAAGTTDTDASTVYEENIDYLANNIIAYYNVMIDNAPEMRDGFKDLAKKIYGKVNYTVSKAYPYGSVYLVDVTISPIDLFSQSSAEVAAYVYGFNEAVADGKYNDYELAAYEKEFAEGLLEILNKAADTMSYADPVVLTVEIVESDDGYSIRERDLMDIDACMFNTNVVVTEAPQTTTEE